MSAGARASAGRSAGRLVRDFLALSGGELVAKLAGFAAFAYLARALPAESYGSVELAVALTAFATLIVDFGFGPIGARDLASQPQRARELAASIPSARLGLALLGAAGVVACSFLLDQTAEARTLIRLYALSLLAAPWNLNWLFQGLGAMAWVPAAQSARMIAFAAGVVLLVRGAADLWKVGAIEVGAAALMVLYYTSAQRHRVGPARLDFDPARLRPLFVEALPVGLSRILWAVQQYAATPLVAFLAGGIEVAWFAAAHRVVTSAGSFAFLYHFNLYPQLVRTLGARPEALETLLCSSFRLTAWLGVLAGLAGSSLAEPVSRIVFGERFTAAAPALAVLAWLLPVSLLGSHARFALIAYGRQRSELVANATAAAVAVLLALAAIPRWGAVGAAAAMVASSLVAWAVAQRFARSQVGRVPFLAPLLRPLLAAAGAHAVVAGLSLERDWVAGSLVVVLYAAAAPWLEPALRADLRALRVASNGRGSPP